MEEEEKGERGQQVTGSKRKSIASSGVNFGRRGK